MSEGVSGLFAAWVAQAPQLVGPIYPWVSAGHILALGLLIGSIVAVDLRLLGLFARLPLADTARALTRLAAIALAATLLTGLMLFSVQPSHYLDNSAFVLKMGLIVAGLVNVAVMHLQTGWRRLGQAETASAGVRVSAAASLLIWISAVFAGRWIAFL